MAPKTAQQQLAMLSILLATCRTTLEAFHAADNVLDADFVADLQRIIGRTEGELERLRTQLTTP